MKNSTRLLIFIMALGFALRIWGIDFGLPYLFHADETHTVNLSASLGYNLLNPRIFWKPAFLYNLIAFEYGIFFLLGKIAGVFPTLQSFKQLFVLNPTPFYLIARISTGVFFGTLTIPAVYLLGERFYSRRVGILSALFLAVSFIHVQNSHYAAHDIPVLFFIVLTVVSSFDIYQNGRRRDYLITAVLFGLAVSTKYNAALAFVPVFIAHILSARKKRLPLLQIIFSKNLFLLAFVSVAVFFIINPYVIIDFKSFIETFRDLSAVEGYTGFGHHISISLLQGVGWGIFIAGIAGLVLLFKAPLGKSAILLSLPILHYLHLVFFSQHHERYMLAIIPFWIVLAGLSADRAIGFFVRRYSKRLTAALLLALVLLIIFPTCKKSIYADSLFSGADTRILAAEWIEANIPNGSRILVDNTFFAPCIRQSYSQLKEKDELIRNKGLTGLQKQKLDILIEACKEEEGLSYDIFYLGEPDQEKNVYIFSSYPRAYPEEGGLKSNSIEYIVLATSGRQKSLPEWLPEKALLVKTISPYKSEVDFRDDEYISVTAGPFTGKNLFTRAHNGPLIRIYSVATKSIQHKDGS